MQMRKQEWFAHILENESWKFQDSFPKYVQLQVYLVYLLVSLN